MYLSLFVIQFPSVGLTFTCPPSLRLHPCFGIPPCTLSMWVTAIDAISQRGETRAWIWAFTFAFQSFPGLVGALNVMLVSEQRPGNNPASKIEYFHIEPRKIARDSCPCLKCTHKESKSEPGLVYRL